jgi:hypothetical protein
MATFQIHRLKNHLRQGFRYAPHVSGTASIKPRDYEAAGTVEASTPYVAFFSLRETPEALEVGDVLEANGSLQILKFVGFEQATWALPDPKPAASAQAPPEDGQTSATHIV